MSTEKNKPAAEIQETGNNQTQATAKPANNNKKIIIIICVVIGVFILFSVIATVALGYLGKKAVESGISAVTDGNVKIDANKDGASFEIKGRDGESFQIDADSKKLPDDYPSFVPNAYSSSQLKGTTRTKIGGVASFSSSYEVSGATLQGIVDYYEGEMEQRGFESTLSMVSDDSAMLSFSKDSEGERHALMVSASEKNGGKIEFSVVPSITQVEQR